MPSVDVTELRPRFFRGSPEPLQEWLRLPERAARVARSRGIYHATSVYHAAPFSGRKTVLSVQDIIPLDCLADARSGIKTRFFHALVTSARVVLASSGFTAERLMERFKLDPHAVLVAPLPPSVVGIGETPPCQCALPLLPRSFALALADLRVADRRKRNAWLPPLARSLRDSGISLVLAGPHTEHVAAVNVIGVGRLCDQHLRQLMSSALCFVFPSAYEGQGLPPQEALAAGTPVVAFHNSSLPEAVGPGAILLPERDTPWRAASRPLRGDDPEVERLADAVLRLAGDESLRADLVRRGREHIAAFTPEAFQSRLTEAYARASA